jgi:hypothetical protein
MSRRVRRCLLVLICAASIGAASIDVKVAQITETRDVTLIKKVNVFTSERPKLNVKLNLKGAELLGATKWGKVKLAEAVDDAGTDLKPTHATAAGQGDDWDDVERLGHDEKQPADWCDVELELAVSARKATAIKSLKGELQVLAGGEEKVVTLTKLTSSSGKPLDDPVLKAAGLQVTPIKSERDDSALTLQFSGSDDGLKDVEIVDAAGKKINNSYLSSRINDQRTSQYDLDRPLDDKVVVKLHLVVGQRTVTVPFDLKDLKLP